MQRLFCALQNVIYIPENKKKDYFLTEFGNDTLSKFKKFPSLYLIGAQFLGPIQ